MDEIDLPLGQYKIGLQAIDEIRFGDYSGSAWRGLFGHALKRTVCVTREPHCSGCMLYHSCVYSWIFETPPPEDSKIMRRYPAVPHPFILSPEFSLRKASAGELMDIGLTLVGKANQYLPYVIEAFRRMGEQGIGSSKSRFKLIHLKQHVDSAQGNWQALYENGRLQKPADPLTPKLPALPKSLEVTFVTPLRIRSGGQLMNPARFAFRPFISSLLRRLSALSYFHTDTPLECDFRAFVDLAGSIKVHEKQLYWHDWTRYSSRQKTSMKMGGLLGSFKLHGEQIEPFWPVLHLAQWMHAGKGAVMGLGKYAINPDSTYSSRLDFSSNSTLYSPPSGVAMPCNNPAITRHCTLSGNE